MSIFDKLSPKAQFKKLFFKRLPQIREDLSMMLDALFLEAGNTNGRYYHSIMYGKNVMGAYADKISYEERWNVIHWIRALQAKEQGKDYNENINTLNSTDTPFANVRQVAEMHGAGTHHTAGDGHTHDEAHPEGDHPHDSGSHENDQEGH